MTRERAVPSATAGRLVRGAAGRRRREAIRAVPVGGGERRSPPRDDALVHEAPAIAGRRTPSALAHAAAAG
jgi:hypothetical protein